MIAVEGMYSGQSIYAGLKAENRLGNILPLMKMGMNKYISNVEQMTGDRGCLARASGNYAQIVRHNLEDKITCIKLPSGAMKNVPSACRAMVGPVAGGSRAEKPILKAGRAYYKYKAKRNKWPKVRGVAMNPVEHPYGGGAHQHIGNPSTITRRASPGKKVGLIAARRTGLIR